MKIARIATTVRSSLAVAIAGAVTFGAGQIALADEGMWTLDNFPTAKVKQTYGVEIGPDWLNRVQRSITRHESGCTGSFASGDGLVLTNHHCVVQCLSQLSSEREDLNSNGFLARTRAEERKCPGEIVSVLMGTEDVTAAVNKATQGLATAEANEARKRELSRLEAACTANSKKDRKTGPLACESVTLYQGGQYFLYKYKRYDDVRLVMAPHDAIAAFGGDPDNFNFPRWCLDFSLLRAYENGKPAVTPNHLEWHVEGPKAGEPVFVVGHPGTTQRLFTSEQLEFQRNTSFPIYLTTNSELRGRMIQWGKTGAEPARIIQDSLQSLENSLKVYRNLHVALLDDTLMDQKAEQMKQLRELAANKPELAREIEAGEREIAEAMDTYRQIYDRYLFLEGGFNSTLLSHARALVRAAAERQLPNERRLREYADSNLPKIEANIKADAPIYPEFEQLKLSFSLEKLRELLGPDDPTVRKLLSKESPETLAKRIVSGTKLDDAKVRAELWNGGAEAVANSQDPAIVLMRELDSEARALRKRYEDEVQARVAAGQEKLAKARFALLGTSTYPDATFTLRVSFGSVAGWSEKGQEVPPFTQLGRLYERATGEPPFELPQVWLDAKSKLDMDTRFNFVTTNDIVGGNSGSPVIDAQGRLVGLAFDGNIHSIAGRYGYDAELNRAVAVHPAILMTALTQVYPAQHLAKEITAK